MVLANSSHKTGDVDYVPPGSSQMRQRQAARSEDADDVEVNQRPKLFNREFVNRFVRRMPSSVVDQTVQFAVAGDRGVDEIVNILSLSDIAVNERSAACSLLLRGILQIRCDPGSFVFLVAPNPTPS